MTVHVLSYIYLISKSVLMFMYVVPISTYNDVVNKFTDILVTGCGAKIDVINKVTYILVTEC